MGQNKVADEVSKYMQSALAAAPGEVRDALRQEAPKVVKALAALVTDGNARDRHWAFANFFALVRATIARDTQLANAIARRHEAETARILAVTKQIEAKTQAAIENRKARAATQKALRVLSAARNIEGEVNAT